MIAPPDPKWRIFVHIDKQQRISADHTPICGTRSWSPGDVIVDRLGVEAMSQHRGIDPGTYTVYVGWFKDAERASATGPGVVAGMRVSAGTIDFLP